MWGDKWGLRVSGFKVSPNSVFGSSISSVGELICKKEGSWDAALVNFLFSAEQTESVLSISISVSNTEGSQHCKKKGYKGRKIYETAVFCINYLLWGKGRTPVLYDND